MTLELTDIPKYIQIGMKDKNWFAECEQLFVEIYGGHRLRLVSQLFSATSQASSLKSNIQLFRKALHQWDNHLPFQGYLPGIKNQLIRLRSGEGLSGLKVNAFANAMSGDVNAVVVDRWLLRAFKMDRAYMRHTGPHKGKVLSGGATKKQFATIESWVRQLWSGVRIAQSGDRETHYKTILKQKLYNMYENT